MKPSSHALFLACALAAAALVQGCNGQSDQQLLTSAKSYLEKKDTKAAIIQLKAALKANPQSGEARYLLGKALLEGGDAANSGVELRKANDLKYDDKLVVPLLARALLAQGESRKVTDDYAAYELKDPNATAELKTSLALAYARQDKPRQAEEALAAALKASPDYAPAKFLRAQAAAEKRDFAGALALLDEITTQAPDRVEAWLLKGEVQQNGVHDDAAALASYRKVVALRNDIIAAHRGIVALLIAAGDVDAAGKHVEQLKKALPKMPGVWLLDAQMALTRKDFEGARKAIQPLLQLSPNDPVVLQTAGAAEFYLRSMTLAESLLARAVQYGPGMPMARQLLVQTYLRTGQPEKALDALHPVIESAQAPAPMLTLAGEAYLLIGDPKRAEELFLRATKLQPNDSRAQTALALGQISKGNAASGLSRLESLSAAGPGISADMALIATHLRRNDTDKALKAIDALQRKQPDRPLAANLRGRVLMLRQDAVGARASFERALALDPAYFPAIASLAALDLAEKKPEAARKRFEDLLHTEPSNYRAQLALANLAARAGAPSQEVADHIVAAVRASPSEPLPRLQLVNHYLAVGNNKAALVAAQEAVVAVPASRELTHALGRAQLAGGDFQQAVSSFSKLATMQPKSPLAPLGLADAYMGLKDYGAAEGSLKRALEINPQLAAAQRALIGLYIADGRYTEALALARDSQKQLPAQALGYQLEGDIELQRRHWDAALLAYRAGLQKAASTELAIKVHSALGAASRSDEADRFAAKWQSDHAQDAPFRYYLGDVALGRKDWPQAEARYREVLQLQPDNAMAMNNVAWLLIKQSKPGAVAMAEKANELAPQQPQLLDTLAMALEADNQLPRALELQKKTVERAPDDPTLRLNLARLYLKSGSKTEGRVELEKLAKLGKKFADQDQVTELLKSI